MVEALKPLEAPKLDTRTAADFVEIGKRRMFEASGGLLNDFSPAGGLITDIESTASALEEMLVWVNQLPDTFLIKYFQTIGVQRRVGLRALATVVVGMSTASSGAFTIPAGFQFGASGIIFETMGDYLVPAFATQAILSVRSVEYGSKTNVEAGAIKTVVQPFGFLSSVTNPDEAKGGDDEETLDDLKVRAFQFVRRRGLISADDFESAITQELGKGSFAYAIPNLGADKVTIERGSVHVFALNPGGSTLNAAQLAYLTNKLSEEAVWATIRVSPLEVLEIDVEIVAEIGEEVRGEEAAAAIAANLKTYLTPGNLQPGKPILIKEVEYQVRQTKGVLTVNSAAMYSTGGMPLATNLPLPNQQTSATLRKADIVLSGREGQTSEYIFVNGVRT